MNPLRQGEYVGAQRSGEATNPLTFIKHNPFGNVAHGGCLLAHEIFPSTWCWTNRQSQHKGCENTFAVPLAVNQNKK